MKRISILVCCLFFYIMSVFGIAVPRLSPLPVDIEQNKMELSGTWMFNTSPETNFWKHKLANDWHSIEVPGEWVMQGFEVKRGRTAGYSRTFTVPDAWKERRIKLRCNAIYSESRIFINGQEASYHLGGFTAFESDVTELIRFGQENRIDVAVACESTADSLSSGSTYAAHPLGGITRDIFLFSLPRQNLAMFHVATAFDATYTDAILKVQAELANESTVKTDELGLRFLLSDSKGVPVDMGENYFPVGECLGGQTLSKEYSFHVKAPKKWNPECPYLYKLRCQLVCGSTVVYETVRNVGFRQIEVRGNQMFVNGTPIKLRGVCRHEVMPLRGRSLTGNVWRKDVELFQRGNVNYIRTSHYPPDEALLDACDELGMFVEVEAPFCWAHKTKQIDGDKRELLLVNQHVEMINQNRSHPCVLMWSIGNESKKYEEYFKRAAEVVKQIDPTRPRIFSQWKPDADGGELEVTNHHYPGPSGPDKYRKYGRPVVFDEYCHLNAYNRFELSADPGLRSMWGELLDRMWNDMYHSKGVLGGAIWAGIDDTFFLPDGRAVGYGTWGPVDGWRRKKPEYWGMKKAYSPVRMTLCENRTPDGNVLFEVENRYLFSNLSACTFHWTIGKYSGDAKMDVPARESGKLTIKLPKEVLEETYLSVEVHGVQGFVVDEYKFQICPIRLQPSARKKSGTVKCKETPDVFSVTTLSGTYGISKQDGLLEGYRQTLMVLPLNSEGRGIQMTGESQDFEPYNPVCTHWVATSIEKIERNGCIEFEVKGKYQEAEGVWYYRFLSTGEVSVSYKFKMLKEVSPRQIGVVMSFPQTYTQLQWKRKGYWSVYPKDHIGALEGTADLFNPSLPISSLAGSCRPTDMPWSFDQTASGSNMFRSTKENIYEATLSDFSRKKTCKVLSDGTQSVRCWKEGTNIKMLVADYNNAGREGYLSSHIQYAYRPLRCGDTVAGEVLLLNSNIDYK